MQKKINWLFILGAIINQSTTISRKLQQKLQAAPPQALPRSHAHTDQLGHCAVAVSFTCVLLGVTSS